MWDGHGTHVAGTICAEGNNGVRGLGCRLRMRVAPLRTRGGTFAGRLVLLFQPGIRSTTNGACCVGRRKDRQHESPWIDTNACSTRGFDDPMPLIDEQRALTFREWTVGTNRILGAAVKEIRARGLDVL